jgi:hypothetical protein
MTEGPTADQMNRLWQALVNVQTVASDPELSQHGDVFEKALAAAYEISDRFAVIGIVSYARGRFEALQELARTSPFGEATITFPRAALLRARPPGAPEALHTECVDLLEAEVDERDIDPLVVHLIETGGLNAFRLLTLLCVLLGKMVVRADPTLASMRDLLARETGG